MNAPLVVARDLVRHFHGRKGMLDRGASVVHAVNGVDLEIGTGRLWL